MPSPRPRPRVQIRRIRNRVRNPDPRLLSFGSLRSPSPTMEGEGEAINVPGPLPLEGQEGAIIAPGPLPLEGEGEAIVAPGPLQLEAEEQAIVAPGPLPLEGEEEAIIAPGPLPLEGEDQAIIAPGPLPPEGEEVDEGIINHVVIMFAMDEPRPDPRAVRFLLDELQTMKLPYHVMFNKIDLVDTKAIAEWEDRLKSWGVYPVSFVSLRNHLGLQDLDSILGERSSLLLGPHNVGKTSLVEYVTKNRSNDTQCDLSTVLQKAGKWLIEKCDASLLINEDCPENPNIHTYCIDLYKDTTSGTRSRNGAFVVQQKGRTVKKLLERDAPTLNDMVQWVTKMEDTEECLYFMKCSSEDEKTWWKQLHEKNKGGLSSLHKKLDKGKGLSVQKLLKDYHVRELVEVLYKGCMNPCEDDEKVIREILRLVKESPKLLTLLAHGPPFLAICVTLMLVGQEATKIACAQLLHALADEQYDCKILIGELGGFQALTELIQYGGVCARKAAVKTLSVLVSVEENRSKILVTGVPEALICLLAEDGEDALAISSRIFSQLGSFELAWNRFFAAAFELLSERSTTLYNAVMQSLLRIKHSQNMRIEYLERSLQCERDNGSLELEGLSEC